MPSPEPPENKDIPHVEYAVISQQSIKPNTQVEALIKLRDLGFDLENPSGVSVRDHLQRPLSVERIGLGYVEIHFMATTSSEIAHYAFTVTLVDHGGRANTQSIPFRIDENQSE